jgi:hypothetical protein
MAETASTTQKNPFTRILKVLKLEKQEQEQTVQTMLQLKLLVNEDIKRW